MHDARSILAWFDFCLTDDETGKISFKNLKRVAKELGENMTDEELQEMVDEADRDGDGEINEEEFLRIMKKVPARCFTSDAYDPFIIWSVADNTYCMLLNACIALLASALVLIRIVYRHPCTKRRKMQGRMSIPLEIGIDD